MRKIIVILMIIVSFSFWGCNNDEKSLSKNFGVTNIETNISFEDGETKIEALTADDIVPNEEELTRNLKEASYSITSYTDVSGSKILTSRIYAEKGSSFIDICYGLTEEDLQTVFDYFESIYPQYYILAINGNYVYCIGDEDVFRLAGFTSIRNIGTQYIYE
ncbi:hypothetical protein I5677_01885 [Mobilitalea sibirica]|uniref:Uncharacterized protein n=1 Tax=Mobilitalea sibirica TaxID=1462919 RepID=A0A8J7HA61_9FIRM|nr:hypothetical protein [Mobilitalea sibirica]MBH1939641.1 hypothetical protein [Mobilitalea sibirica]